MGKIVLYGFDGGVNFNQVPTNRILSIICQHTIHLREKFLGNKKPSTLTFWIFRKNTFQHQIFGQIDIAKRKIVRIRKFVSKYDKKFLQRCKISQPKRKHGHTQLSTANFFRSFEFPPFELLMILPLYCLIRVCAKSPPEGPKGKVRIFEFDSPRRSFARRMFRNSISVIKFETEERDCN